MKFFSKGDYIADRYRVVDIKKGGMGIVYLCYDEAVKMPVALKSLVLINDRDWKSILGNFIREARTWISIGRIQYVVEAYGIVNVESEDGIVPHIAMELIEGHPVYGESLLSWIYNSALSFDLIWFIAINLCTGMIRIKNKLLGFGDFVHRDLKPQNILFSKEGCIKITDFGLTKPLFDNFSLIDIPSSFNTKSYYTYGTINNVCGTPPYMSPEQCMGSHTLDQRSDIYSYGCILYEMCTAGFIFQVNSPQEFIENHIHKSHIPVEHLNPDIPKFFAKLINNCLAKNPDDRPQSFEDIRNYLMSELRKNDQLCHDGIKFTLFGFSYLSDNPRIMSDWNMENDDEALILGNAFGVDYIVKQGIIKNKAEWDKIVEDNDKRKNRKERLKKYESEKEIDELVRKGDSFIKLAKSVDEQEKIKFIRSAISNYQSANNKLPNSPQITFRIGLSYSVLAEIMEEENELISDDLFTLAIEEFESILEQTKKPFIIEFDDIYYLLPYHALFHKAAAYISIGDYQNALKNFKRLINRLEVSVSTEFRDISEQIKQNTIKATELLLKKINE